MTHNVGRRRVQTDSHITVYCGQQAGVATQQGDVFLVGESGGEWRIMSDSERSDDGKAIDLYDYPTS